MNFRKKPVVIEAIQWNGNNEEYIYAFIDSFDTKELNRMKNAPINKGM